MEIRIKEGLKLVQKLDERAMVQAKKRWDSVAKPLNSLGLLEEAVIKIAGIQKTPDVNLNKKAVVICCGGNGIVEEGVTQTGQEVTAIVTENFTRGESCVCLMAKQAGAKVFPIDLGVAAELSARKKRFRTRRPNPYLGQKNSYGNQQFSPWSGDEQKSGGRSCRDGNSGGLQFKKAGYSLIATGEMGIGILLPAAQLCPYCWECRRKRLLEEGPDWTAKD